MWYSIIWTLFLNGIKILFGKSKDYKLGKNDEIIKNQREALQDVKDVDKIDQENSMLSDAVIDKRLRDEWSRYD